MYVIQITGVRTATAAGLQAVAGFTIGTAVGDTATLVVPAENCSWQIVPATSGRGYSVTGLRLLTSAVPANPEDLWQDVDIDYRFGYIGKSGRFVEIAS